MSSLKPVLSQPGVYRLSGAPETSLGSGIYVVSDVPETSPGSGIYLFPLGDAFEVTTTANPPAAHMVFDGEDLPSGTHTIVVTRSYGGLTSTVRSAWSLFADGGAVLDDWEIPVGVPVTYEAEAFAPDGTSLGKTGGVTVQVDSERGYAWVSDPINPNLVVRVRMDLEFGNTRTRIRQVQTYQIGSRVVALLGAQGKLQDIPLGVYTTTFGDADLLSNVLSSTAVLVRTMPPARLPRLLYTVISQINDVAQDEQVGGELVYWDLTGQEVSPTTLDILVPVVTYQTYMDAFPGATYADVMAVYTGTYLDAIKNPPGV